MVDVTVVGTAGGSDVEVEGVVVGVTDGVVVVVLCVGSVVVVVDCGGTVEVVVVTGGAVVEVVDGVSSSQ